MKYLQWFFQNIESRWVPDMTVAPCSEWKCVHPRTCEGACTRGSLHHWTCEGACTNALKRVRKSKCKVGALDHFAEGFHVRGHHDGHLPIDLSSGKTRIETKSKMFEEIFKNQGIDHITENILIKLDLKSLCMCRLVCKGLHHFITSLEKSRKLKADDFKIIRRIRLKKFLAHPNLNAAFNSIRQEDNFYRRRGLIDLLETYKKQDKILQFGGPVHFDSYLNASKFLINVIKMVKNESLFSNLQFMGL